MFTARVQYALLFLKSLEENKGLNPVKLKDIAEENGLKMEFLEQVARRLRIEGYVDSIKGPGGGYVLAKNLEKETFLKLFGVVQPASKLKIACTNPKAQKHIEKLHKNYLNSIKDMKLL